MEKSESVEIINRRIETKKKEEEEETKNTKWLKQIMWIKPL